VPAIGEQQDSEYVLVCFKSLLVRDPAGNLLLL
jgi:hypothetical protein